MFDRLNFSRKFLLQLYGGFLAFALMLTFGFSSLPDEQLHVSVLDVGQGDAILIRTPSNQKILIDTGPSASVLSPLGRELNFFDRRLDLVILTHPDSDHVAGASEIFRRYEIGQILFTGVAHESAVYDDILTQIAEKKISLLLADPAHDFDFGNGVTLDVLSPNENLVGVNPSDSNATSIVTRLKYGKTSMLLTGDAEITTELALLKTPINLHSDILKLGHHGAKTSSSEAFLVAVNPEIALISVGRENKFGHPAPETLAKLHDQKILMTSKQGTLKLVSDGKVWREDGEE